MEDKIDQISFSLRESNEPIMIISKDKFYWNGEEIKDIYNVYERFNEWLTNAEGK